MSTTVKHGVPGQSWCADTNVIARQWWKKCRLVTLLIWVLSAAAPVSLPQSAAPPKREIRRILIFNELGLWSPGIAAINREIFSAFEKSPYQIEFYTEDLDTSLFPDEASQGEFRDWYLHKYRDRKPDLIIAIGPSPLKFMSESHAALAIGTPIVFWGSTEEFAEPPKLDGDFTGVWGVARPDKTLDAALQLQPGTKHVVVVGGVAPYDRHLEALVKDRFRGYESKFDFTYLTELAMPDLLERLKHLPSNTIVYHTSIMKDGAGTHFVDATESVPAVAAAANAPVFVVDDVDVGRGTVGGYVFSFTLAGQDLAAMAVRILNGEKPQNLPIVKSTNLYLFDWRALGRWGLKESDLPRGSVVLNRQPTVWESYKTYIIGAFSLILVQALLILGLLWQRKRRRAVESELALALDRLQLAVEAGRSVGWDWDIKTGQDRWFGDLETVFGIPGDTYSGHVEDFHRRVHPEDRGLVWKAVADARQNRKPYVAEFRVLRTDGTVRWITARGQFHYLPNGEADRMLGMAVDVTDRKRAEQGLRESQDRLAGIVASAMDAIIAVDEEERIVLFNTAAEKMFGCTQRDAIGTPIKRYILQSLQPEHREQIQPFGESRIPAHAIGSLGTLWAIRANGEEFPIEASISYVDTDEKKLLTVIIRDITDRRKAEAAIRESEERFRLVANTAPVLIWMSGPDRLCVYFNQPWLDFTGRSLAEELGNGWAEGVHPEDLQPCLDTYKGSFDRRESFKMLYRFRRRDGEYRWVFNLGVPRFNSDGSFAGYIGSCIDVTERKMAEEALASLSGRLIEVQEEEHRRIAREIHDDYNQRLAVLANDLEELAQHVEESPAAASQRLHQLWNGVSEIAADLHSLSHSLHPSTLENLGLVAGVRAFCNEFSTQQQMKIHFVHEKVPRGLPTDVTLCLFRVTQEGLRNIKRHSGANRAEVRLETIDDKLHLSICDQGRGFDLNQHSPGSGIGIRSMEERLRSLGGHLEVRSRPLEGTRIDAWLPFDVALRRTG